MVSLLHLELELLVSGTLIMGALGIWREKSHYSPPLKISMEVM